MIGKNKKKCSVVISYKLQQFRILRTIFDEIRLWDCELCSLIYKMKHVQERLSITEGNLVVYLTHSQA